MESEEINVKLEKSSKSSNLIDTIIENYNKISSITEFQKKKFHPSNAPKYRTKVAPIETLKVEKNSIVQRIVENFDTVKEFSKQLKEKNIENFGRDINIDFSSHYHFIFR